jgi:light-regulated signal transduction histidine kinase (bacteriophytochrome)
LPNEVDISNCDREPIHIPGQTQSHGCLIACDATLESVLRHSANAPAMLGLDPARFRGAAFAELVGESFAHSLRNALSKARDPRRPGLLFGRRLPGAPASFDISVHAFNNCALVEFEPAATEETGALDIARNLISRTHSRARLQDLIAIAPRLVRAVLGYDRVMIYRFAEDGSGKVIAEDKRVDLESFSGQHFPAGDIPAQARALYLNNTLRVINDAHDVGVALEPGPLEREAPTDLSYAHLRAVSPIHLEYLRNMGVAASMSLSIVVNGALWGLVACHNYAPKALTLAERVAVEMFAEVFSLRVEAFERAEALSAATRAREALDRIVAETSAETRVDDFLRSRLTALNALIPSDGVALILDGEWSLAGVTPPADRLAALVGHLRERGGARVYATHSLSREFAEAADYAAEASGLLAVPLSQSPRDYLVFFRREQVETLNWGGDPNKTYASGPNGDRLSPRKSFEIWKETVRCQSAPWSSIDRQTAETARVQLLEIMMRHSEALARQRREADVRQKTLNEELNHRVKNILALIKSLVSQDVSAGGDVASYAAALRGRIIALANAHDQVVRSDGGGQLTALARAELGPYANRDLEIAGPEIVLDARAYSVLALVLHELATNAAKYGALSVAGGRLQLRWSIDENGDCRIDWRESGGPQVAPPSRVGFGASLIRRSVPFDLGGESEIEYLPDGLWARLKVPQDYFEDRSAQSAAVPVAVEAAAPGPRPLANQRVLLVEDQFVIALDAEQILMDSGAGEVMIAATPAEAERMLAGPRPDIAVLDVNLGRTTSLSVAGRLRDMGVKFIFATGYGDSRMIPEEFREAPVVRKPYSAAALVAAIGDARRR